jgi:hypothetical protein
MDFGHCDLPDSDSNHCNPSASPASLTKGLTLHMQENTNILHSYDTLRPLASLT